MKISHEVPLCLLKTSKNFNDYDYCLVHLLDKYPEYKEYYVNSLKEGRKVLLDNSLYELGEAFNSEDYAKHILELKPTEYIIPDSTESAEKDMQLYKEFTEKYSDLPGIKIGVVQGENLDKLIECYKFMSEHADKIAIPFRGKWYESKYKKHYNISDETFNSNPNHRLESWSFGRRLFIKTLIDNDVWNQCKPHHLLGCSFPSEFDYVYYRFTKNIESVDTSNPIMAAIDNIEYTRNGIDTKSTTKMCDIMETKIFDKNSPEYDSFKMNLVYHNTTLFKTLFI